jgi:hypothetical protein
VIVKLKAVAGQLAKIALEMFSGRGLGGRKARNHGNSATGRIGASGACMLESDFLREFRGTRD